MAGLSAQARFEFACTAAHADAFAALHANDLRPAIRPGHGAVVFLTLARIIDAPAARGSSLNRSHTMRNKPEHGQWVEASEAEARDAEDSRRNCGNARRAERFAPLLRF